MRFSFLNQFKFDCVITKSQCALALNRSLKKTRVGESFSRARAHEELELFRTPIKCCLNFENVKISAQRHAGLDTRL